MHKLWSDNQTEVTRAFIENGADWRIKNDEGQIALEETFGSETKPHLIDLLIENGLSVSRKDSSGKTLLARAAEYENFRVVDQLIKLDSDISAADNQGLTPVFYAVGSGNMRILRRFLAEEPDLNVQDNDGRTVLHYALNWEPKSALIKLLLDAGVDPNVSTDDGSTALMLAFGYRRSLPVYTALVEGGADLTYKNLRGQNILHILAQSRLSRNDITFLKRILKDWTAAGLAVDIPDNYGRTPLHIAAESSQIPDIITSFVGYGADPNVLSENGLSPLHLAISAYYARVDIVKALVKSGANVNLRTIRGDSPLSLSYRNADKKEISDYLISQGAQ